MTSKCTKKWTTRDGVKIRICDMSDSHLLNTIRMLDRMATQLVCEGYRFLGTLHGEMAIDAVERAIDHLEEDGGRAVHDLYDDLAIEAIRRNLNP